MRFFFNRAIRTLLAANAIILMAGAMLAPIYALFVDSIGGDLMDASLTGGIFSLAAGMTSFISGRYADHIKRKDYVIVLGACIMSFGFLLMTIVDSIFSLFIVQAIIGLGEAIYYPPYDALYSQHIDGHKAATTWGAWESMDYFITAIGAVIGGMLASQLGFNSLFISMSAVSLISGVYLYFLPRRILNT